MVTKAQAVSAHHRQEFHTAYALTCMATRRSGPSS
jgi:hypothetical protein